MVPGVGAVVALVLGCVALTAFAGSMPLRPGLRSAPVEDASWVVQQLPAGPGPLDNPLKGWCTYSDEGTTHSMYSSMAFWYKSWRALEPAEGDYRFAEWEREWDTTLGRDKHVVLRVYLDYPTLTTGMPQWLIDRGVRMTPYTQFGGGLSPDYADERLVVALERLIAALGERYDGHPRVAAVQAGLLGFWGEWHTYPTPELFAPPATQARVLVALRAAFPSTVVQVRYGDIPTGPTPWNGYHDDYFPEDTDCFIEGDPCTGFDWYFMPGLRGNQRQDTWMTRMIGGEMIPGAAHRLLSDTPFSEGTPVPPGTTNWQLTQRMLDLGHFSWLGPYNPALESAPRVDAAVFLARGEEMVRRLGYEFELQTVGAGELHVNRPLVVELTGINRGVAPFAYPWAVELALIDRTTTPPSVAQVFTTSIDVRTWLPGAFTARAVAAPVAVRPGRYALAIGIRDPWRNVPAVRFANTLSVIDGWTVLADVVVR